MVIQCEDYIGLPDYGDGKIVFDNKGVAKAGTSVENAFLSGDPEKVKEVVSPSSLNIYSELIEASTEENLNSFGEAIKTRELKILSEKYAEFKFTVDGQEYTSFEFMESSFNFSLIAVRNLLN